jgi:hypothetical protein
MTPWHIYLVANGMITHKEFGVISNGDDHHEWYHEDYNK